MRTAVKDTHLPATQLVSFLE